MEAFGRLDGFVLVLFRRTFCFQLPAPVWTVIGGYDCSKYYPSIVFYSVKSSTERRQFLFF